MGGKAILLVVIGFSMIFSVVNFNSSNTTTRAVENLTEYYSKTTLHNIAASGANMAANKIFIDPDWTGSYSKLPFQGGELDINVSTFSVDKIKIISKAYYTGIFNGETIHLIVAHWPSRGGGEKRSRPLRAAAADVGRSIIDSILTAEPSAKIIYMGDLNDDPSNASLKVNMRSTGKLPEVANGRLFNTMDELYRKGIGSLAYRDSWNLFDQILVTEALVAGDYSGYQYHMSRVYNKPFLREQTGRFEGYPKRSYSYGNYIGGYSDHFPTYIVLLKEITQ